MPREIPDRPLVVIGPRKQGLLPSLRELWEYRDLLHILTMRDIRVRYKQTALGAAWALLQPLLAMMIFTIFLSRIEGISPKDVPYPLFVLAGLVPWTFFSNAVTNSGSSLVVSSALITKVYFPRMIIPTAPVVAGLLDLTIGFGLLLVLMSLYGIHLSLQFAMLVPLTLLLTALAVGTGLWISALNVKYRDFRHALPFFMQLWFFATPIVFPSTVLPPRWRGLLAVNPMTGVVEGYRAACFSHPVDWSTVATAAMITLAMLLYSSHTFRRMERSFADII